MFGDKFVSNKKNETWVYDLSENKWTNKHPINNPYLMKYPKIASVLLDDKIVLFGGCGTSGQDNNETWVYDLSDNKWQNKSLTNPTPTNYPSSRYVCGFSSIWGTNKVILFGGKSQSNYYNDIWIYDVDTNTWVEKKPTGSKPSTRTYIEMVTITGTDKVLMFGGNYSTPTETWIYDLSDNKWTKMMKLPSELIAPRLVPIYGTNKILLFGGFKGYYINETWIFDLNGGSKGAWRNITNSTTPPLIRYRHAMAAVYNTNKVVLFGGAIGQSPWTGDDTWIFKHSSNATNGTYVSMPFDTGTNSTFYTISWTSEVPVNTSLRIQLRTALDEENLSASKFVGPDGTEYSFYTSSQTDTWSGHDRNRWIQYKIYFNKTNNAVSPTLKDITITYNCLPNTIIQGPINGSVLSTDKPVFQWIFDDHDSITQNAFQILIADDLSFENLIYDSGKEETAEQYKEVHLSDGSWHWKVRTQDSDGEWSNYSAANSIIIDTKSPRSIVTWPENNGFYNKLNNISGIAIDPPNGSGIAQVEIVVKRLSDGYFWSGSEWVSTINWLRTSGSTEWIYDDSNIIWDSGIEYSLVSKSIDFADHVEIPASEIIFAIDTELPKSTMVNPMENSWVNKVECISGISEDIGDSGVEKVEISIQRAGTSKYWDGASWSLGELWLTVSGTTNWSYNASNVQWHTGNSYIVKTRAIDHTGNLELLSPGTSFKFDDTAPKQLSIIINDDDEYTSNFEVVLSTSGMDFGSGISDMSFSSDGLNWTEWEPYNTFLVFELSPVNGEKTLYFRLRDLADNVAEPVFDRIILDNEPPSNLTVIINDNAEYTNSNTLTLTIDAKDSCSGLNGITFSLDGSNWLPWEAFKHTRTINLPATNSDGEKHVYFKVNDKAGNIALPEFDSIVLDKTPPKSLSMTINGGVVEVNSTSILLELEAVDPVSGVYLMSFNTGGITWSTWEPFNHERAFNLTPKAGEKTIYFRAMDHAGNIASPVSKTVILNLTSHDLEPVGEEDSSTQKNDRLYMIIVVLALIIIITIIVAFLIIFRRRKKHIEQEVLKNGAITIKPRIFSKPTFTPNYQTPPAPGPPNTPKLEQIPSTATNSLHIKTPQLNTQPEKQKQISTPQQVPQVSPGILVPKLPPANIEKPKHMGDDNTDVTETKKPTVSSTSTPSPTQAEPQQPIKPTIANINTSPDSPIPTTTNTPQPKPTINETPTMGVLQIATTTTQQMLQNIKKTNE